MYPYYLTILTAKRAVVCRLKTGSEPLRTLASRLKLHDPVFIIVTSCGEISFSDLGDTARIVQSNRPFSFKIEFDVDRRAIELPITIRVFIGSAEDPPALISGFPTSLYNIRQLARQTSGTLYTPGCRPDETRVEEVATAMGMD